MSVPVIAIVGRPNVGKSSLFNWLAQKRIAIVDPTAGVTRDRVSTLLRLGERFVELVDTGGMGIRDSDNLTTDIERQIEMAIEEADMILFVVDGKAGIAPLDEAVTKRLRYINKPVILVANKCDDPAIDPQTAEFYKLGRGKLVCVSAQNKRNKQELLDLIQERLPDKAEDEEEGEKPVALKLAIVGRRNVGKSTVINYLAQSDRVIVSEVPGTTRDSIDVRFERDGLTFIAIDTAGVRKKKSLANDIELFSLNRAEKSIRRSDVVLHFIDAVEGISKVDKQLTEYVLKHHKPTIFVVNKWDLMKSTPTSRFAHYIYGNFPSLDFVPIAFITAKDGKNVYRVLNLAQAIHKEAMIRVSTSELNRVVRFALEKQPPPLRQNRRPKIYFATQVGTAPPTIVLFTNGPELFDNTYQRYLIKVLRDHLPYAEVPIKLYLRHRTKSDEVPSELVRKDPAEAEASEEGGKEKKPDLSKLRFRTDLTEDDLEERGGKRYDSELWNDI